MQAGREEEARKQAKEVLEKLYVMKLNGMAEELKYQELREAFINAAHVRKILEKANV
jgi:hypothetical protein